MVALYFKWNPKEKRVSYSTNNKNVGWLIERVVYKNLAKSKIKKVGNLEAAKLFSKISFGEKGKGKYYLNKFGMFSEYPDRHCTVRLKYNDEDNRSVLLTYNKERILLSCILENTVKKRFTYSYKQLDYNDLASSFMNWKSSNLEALSKFNFMGLLEDEMLPIFGEFQNIYETNEYF